MKDKKIKNKQYKMDQDLNQDIKLNESWIAQCQQPKLKEIGVIGVRGWVPGWRNSYVNIIF